MSLGFCLFLFALFDFSHGFGFRGFTFKGLKEPEGPQTKIHIISEKWMEQPVDHFNVRDNRTWSMRYYENAQFFNDSGPIFIMLGGEWTISSGYLRDGQMYYIGKDLGAIMYYTEHRYYGKSRPVEYYFTFYKIDGLGKFFDEEAKRKVEIFFLLTLNGQMYYIGRDLGAIMYYTEHRYYGKSRPVEDTGSENLQYLSVDQALFDVAYFIETIKDENSKLINSSVIVFGGSYAGNVAAWARLEYPHLIRGAVAVSAPVQAKADFFEYYEVVTRSLARSSKKCIEDVGNAFYTVEKLLKSTNGSESLETIFNLCEIPDISSPIATGYFMNTIREKFAGTVQNNKMYVNGSSTISKVCDKMMDEKIGSPILRLGKLVSGNEKCLDINYTNFVSELTNTSWENENGDFRVWFYQTCTEYGFYQTSNSNYSVFGNLVPLDFFVNTCTDLFGQYYDSSLLDSKVKRTNLLYGGWQPNVQNVVFVNGDVDPWHALSVLEDLNDKSPAILIEGSSHCEYMYINTKADSAALIKARKQVRSIIVDWLSSK